jgi:cell division protein FtsI/penicillin-binding protein 2
MTHATTARAAATSAKTRATTAHAATTTTTTAAHKRPVKHYYGVPTYANSTIGDDAEYDDPIVRQAAVDALGRYNGAVVAIDPNNGRILTVVNQQLAFSAGFIPCSTIKPVIALAALGQGVINQDSMLEVARRRYMNLTEALAHSNNEFFADLGRQMGFDTVLHYARMMGLGERTGYDIPEEQSGVLPTVPPVNGGVGRMSSFGEGIQITPLELGSVVATIANGGTQYYLQYPRTPEARDAFEPRVKNQLAIESLLPEVRDGMLAAVLYGTAQRSWDYVGEQPLGKTGSCSDSTSRIGWFASYADELHPRIVLVVLMRGHNHVVQGPTAAEIAGRIYHRLHEENYLSSDIASWESKPSSPAAPNSAAAASAFVSQGPPATQVSGSNP